MQNPVGRAKCRPFYIIFFFENNAQCLFAERKRSCQLITSDLRDGIIIITYNYSKSLYSFENHSFSQNIYFCRISPSEHPFARIKITHQKKGKQEKQNNNDLPQMLVDFFNVLKLLKTLSWQIAFRGWQLAAFCLHTKTTHHPRKMKFDTLKKNWYNGESESVLSAGPEWNAFQLHNS